MTYSISYRGFQCHHIYVSIPLEVLTVYSGQKWPHHTRLSSHPYAWWGSSQQQDERDWWPPQHWAGLPHHLSWACCKTDFPLHLKRALNDLVDSMLYSKLKILWLLMLLTFSDQVWRQSCGHLPPPTSWFRCCVRTSGVLHFARKSTNLPHGWTLLPCRR